MVMYVIRLLEHRANIDATGPDGNTPLHLLAWHGYCKIADKLLEKGAAPSAENGKGQTALEIAIENNHCDFAVLLIKKSDPARWACDHAAACVFIFNFLSIFMVMCSLFNLSF